MKVRLVYHVDAMVVRSGADTATYRLVRSVGVMHPPAVRLTVEVTVHHARAGRVPWIAAWDGPFCDYGPRNPLEDFIGSRLGEIARWVSNTDYGQTQLSAQFKRLGAACSVFARKYMKALEARR